MVLLRFSSLISRMVNNGVTINRMMLATSNNGRATRSVTPGAFFKVVKPAWILKKTSIDVKNDHAIMT